MLVQGFANAIEDTRIERYEVKQFSSLKLEFKRFADYYERDYLKQRKDHETRILTDPEHLFFLVAYAVDLYLAGYKYDYLPESVIAIFEQIKDIVDEYRSKEIDGPKGTLIVVAAANDICKRLGKIFDSLPNIPTSENSGGEDDKAKDKSDKKDKKRKKQSGKERESDEENEDEDEEDNENESKESESGDSGESEDGEGEEEDEDSGGEPDKTDKGDSDSEGDDGGTGEKPDGTEGDDGTEESDSESLSGTPSLDDSEDEKDEKDDLPSLDDFDIKSDGDDPTVETEHHGFVKLPKAEPGKKKKPKDIIDAIAKALKGAAEKGEKLILPI
jgi:hypothetical protein